MPVIRPFRCVRPAEEKAAAIAALPYDVYNRKEAKKVTDENPLSFLKIDRAETQFPDDTDMYSPQVYERARDTLLEMLADGSFIEDEEPGYYLYALTFAGRTQTGIVGCASVDDYLSGAIRRHENTKKEKELDRINHIDTMSAQTGPVFLAYRPHPELKRITDAAKETAPLYDFTTEDGIRHQVWKLSQNQSDIEELFLSIGHIYIADGHHRAASAVKVCENRRHEHPDYDGTEEFNYFLCVLFPADELKIYDYNRVVSGWNGHALEELLDFIGKQFDMKEIPEQGAPRHKGGISMYIEGTWYQLKAHEDLYSQDPVDDLDVSILQNKILEPLFGIQDPRTDPRIAFVGGIRGLEELVRLVDEGPEKAAFAMYPTSMEELLSVADCGRLMPPKSTWFEPKLRSGLFIHIFEQ
ncbi:MAG: DUF1015 domain-containing protein [Ruminococcus sp.]|nr:DUF1015 domain-containing protein [Ruminococcus sp.]